MGLTRPTVTQLEFVLLRVVSHVPSSVKVNTSIWEDNFTVRILSTSLNWLLRDHSVVGIELNVGIPKLDNQVRVKPCKTVLCCVDITIPTILPIKGSSWPQH